VAVSCPLLHADNIIKKSLKACLLFSEISHGQGCAFHLHIEGFVVSKSVEFFLNVAVNVPFDVLL
jgi:hypothetical protein